LVQDRPPLLTYQGVPVFRSPFFFAIVDLLAPFMLNLSNGRWRRTNFQAGPLDNEDLHEVSTNNNDNASHEYEQSDGVELLGHELMKHDSR